MSDKLPASAPNLPPGCTMSEIERQFGEDKPESRLCSDCDAAFTAQWPEQEFCRGCGLFLAHICAEDPNKATTPGDWVEVAMLALEEAGFDPGELNEIGEIVREKMV